MAPTPWSGEIWTDAHGFATVILPDALNGELELHALADSVSVALVGEATPRRFTIETNEPHVKVAWHIRGRPPERSRHA